MFKSARYMKNKREWPIRDVSQTDDVIEVDFHDID